MELTDFQKEVCKRINNREIYDFQSFLISFDHIGEKYEHNIDLNYYNEVREKMVQNEDFGIKKIDKNEILEFLSLWVFLENEKLMLSSRHGVLHISTNKRKPDNNDENVNYIYFIRFHAKLDDFDGKRIIPTPELKKFIQQDFKTNDEIRDKQQRAHSEVQSRLSKKSLNRSTFAIWASIFVAVGSSVFNYCTYTRERNVSIINLDSAMLKYSKIKDKEINLKMEKKLDSLAEAIKNKK